MTATAHALIGGVIATSISDPIIGLPLAAISHPIADMIPHWDFGLGWKKKKKSTLFLQSCLDLLLGILLVYLFFWEKADLLYLAGAVFLSLSWDLLQAPYWFLNWKFPPFSWFYNFQHDINGKAGLPWGIITQVLTVSILFLTPKFFQ